MNDHGLSTAAPRRSFTPAPVTQIEMPARAEPRRVGVPPQTGGLARPSAELRLPRDPYDHRAEKIRGLRTELMLRQDDSGAANFIALLSPQAQEGRSQLAAELAIAFAQLGRPTLLVDADLRTPTQHRLFGTDNRNGLAQAIAGGESANIHPVEGFRELSLLTAGPTTSNPVELLSARRLRDLADGWRAAYDFVIIDTPPVSQFSDGLAVAAVARRVLVLNRANHTPYQETRDLLNRLTATQSQVVGAVINHF